jgi:hypothetical protein
MMNTAEHTEAPTGHMGIQPCRTKMNIPKPYEMASDHVERTIDGEVELLRVDRIPHGTEQRGIDGLETEEIS